MYLQFIVCVSQGQRSTTTLDSPAILWFSVSTLVARVCRVDQLETSAGDVAPEGAQPDPAWLAARRRAMHVHVSPSECVQKHD